METGRWLTALKGSERLAENEAALGAGGGMELWQL